MASTPNNVDADLIYQTASGLMQQTVSSRGYVQMSTGLAVLLAATLLGLSRSAFAAQMVADAESEPTTAMNAAKAAIDRYVVGVRKTTAEDQEAEAALLARTVAASKK